MRSIRIFDLIVRIKNTLYSQHSLDIVLKNQGKDRWLDIGCGGNFTPGFHYLDYFADVEIPEECKNRYYKINLLELTDEDCASIGKFDFIRMQHVFEHFTPEEGQIVLQSCAKLLQPDGIILVTVPDLKKFVKIYTRNSFKKLYTFYHWSLRRFNEDAPASYFFSIYSHSLLHEQHKWCYDSKGLQYAFANTGCYTNIKELKLTNKLAKYPFTHNRPLEDVCVIANIK